MSHTQINNIFQSESSSSTSSSTTILLSFQSPFKAFNASPNGHPLRGRSHRKKATWISAEIDLFLCSRSNVYAISSASFNATRPFCFMLVTVLRASTLVPTYVSSNSYVTHEHLSFFECEQENISSKIGLILSFSLILIWGARLPVVCGSFYFSPFEYLPNINRSGAYRTYRRAIRKATKQQLRKSR